MGTIYLAQALLGYENYSLIHSLLKKTLREQGHIVYDPLEFEVNFTDYPSIVKMDLKYVRKSDLVIADLTYPSLGGGTFGEIYYAAYNQIPVYLIQPPENYGPWMQTFTSKHFWRECLEGRLESPSYFEACQEIHDLILHEISKDPALIKGCFPSSLS